MNPRVRLGALSLAAVLAATAVHAQPADQPASGAVVYDHWCSYCHNPGPGHPGTQALAEKYKGNKPAPLLERRDLTPAVIKYYVRHGVSVMAPFRKTEITDAELDNLATYIASQEKASSGR